MKVTALPPSSSSPFLQFDNLKFKIALVGAVGGDKRRCEGSEGHMSRRRRKES